jgi:hypothetical protein
MGRIVEVAPRLRWLLAVVIVAFMVSRGPVSSYIAELTGEYEGPIEGIVTYLEQHGSPDDVVAITYGDLPLKFYTSMRVVGCDTGEDISEAVGADWIIVRRKQGARAAQFTRFLMERTDMSKYRVVTLSQVDTYWENREEPRSHRFRTATEGPRVRMLHKIEE